MWQKTLKIQELKRKLQKELGVNFNDDKIKSMIQYNYGGKLFTLKNDSDYPIGNGINSSD